MTEINRKVPKLRFLEFTDAWEQRKLGEMVTRYKELVPTPHDGYWKLSIRSHAKGTFLTYVEAGQELEEKQLSKVKSNQLMFNIVFAWEHAVTITSEEDTKALVSHRFPQFSFSDSLKPKFFKYVMLDEKFRQHLWLASPSGAGRNKTLNLNDALDYVVTFPSVEEQEKIGAFFTNLDNAIALHQRKCDDLVKQKQSLMQKIFSREIRFKDKNGEEYPEWEEKSFYKVFSLLQNNTYSRDKLNGSGTIDHDERK